MSFGGVMVDQNGVIDRFPGRSFLAGLFGNALGYTHGDASRLNELQERIEYAARWDVAPERIIDYHTVDLGQPKMRHGGWTTRGGPEHRAGGASAKFGTHQRYRHYWANGIMTAAATLLGKAEPTVGEIASAIAEPSRPLFFGRKTCLPSDQILLGIVNEPDVLTALKKARPALTYARPIEIRMEACWPERLRTDQPGQRKVTVYDTRDWATQLHTGSRVQVEGLLEVATS
jgi:CRISPR system Cascade subunit CasD